MAGNARGVLRTAARKTGVTVAQYQALVESGMKWCSICKQWQPVAEFTKDSSRPDGRSSACRLAQRVRHRTSKLKHRYDLTPEEVAALLVAQMHHCAICREELTKYDVDHDHVTGKVRGLLCHHCNCVLGYARDSALVLRNAIAYLEADR